MENEYSIEGIKLSFQCKKKYGDMIPCKGGAHCTRCDKVVMDFRNKTQNDLAQALMKYGTICGSFRPGQLSTAGGSSRLFRSYTVNLLMALGLSGLGNVVEAQNNLIIEEKDKVLKEDMVFGMVIQTSPSYKYGGETGLQSFLKANLHFDEDCPEGQLMVMFTVDSLGKVVKPKIMKSLSPEADIEAIRVVRLLEFNPGLLRGKRVEVQMLLPISYKREGN